VCSDPGGADWHRHGRDLRQRPIVGDLVPRARKLIATEPVRAMVIGAFVPGLSMRDVGRCASSPG
jgi:hypothetical protein